MRNENTVRSEDNIRENVECKVKWFNTTKGYGFVMPLDGSGDAFIHISKLEKLNLKGLAEGASIRCDLEEKNQRYQVTEIHEVGPAPVLYENVAPEALIEGTVKFFNAEKGFGFVTPDNGQADIFVHMKVLERSGLAELKADQRVKLNVSDGEKGPHAQGVEIL